MRKGSAFPERPIDRHQSRFGYNSYLSLRVAENEARACCSFLFRELLRFRFCLLGSGVLCVSSPRGAGSI
jgi:hypothetical protein